VRGQNVEIGAPIFFSGEFYRLLKHTAHFAFFMLATELAPSATFPAGVELSRARQPVAAQTRRCLMDVADPCYFSPPGGQGL
jgi:hypothetical protein